MALFDVTTGVQTVTGTGAVTGSLDTSAMTGAFTLCVDVLKMTAGATLRLAIEDTANSSAFSDALALDVFDFSGQIVAGADIQKSIRSALKSSVRFGAANTKLRANVYVFGGSSPSADIHVYLTQ